jgi:hypothetical protein
VSTLEELLRENARTTNLFISGETGSAADLDLTENLAFVTLSDNVFTLQTDFDVRMVLLGFSGVLDIGTLDADDGAGDHDFGGLDAFSFAPFDIGQNLP